MKKSGYSYVRMSEPEKQYIREHSASCTMYSIAKYIGVHPSAVAYQIAKMGLPRYEKPAFVWSRDYAAEFMRMYNNRTDFITLCRKYKLSSKKSVMATAYRIQKLYGIKVNRRKNEELEIQGDGHHSIDAE